MRTVILDLSILSRLLEIAGDYEDYDLADRLTKCWIDSSQTSQQVETNTRRRKEGRPTTRRQDIVAKDLEEWRLGMSTAESLAMDKSKW